MRRKNPRLAALLPALLMAAALAGAAAPAPAGARIYVTRDRALALAFGDSALVTTRTVFLDDDQVAAIAAAARAPFAAHRVTYYEARARAGGAPIGHAYIETHRVRSLSETVMVTVGPDGRAARVDVLAFHEPEDYLAPARWRALFEGRGLTAALAPGRELPNLAGATLTARALAAAVRRLLAVHRLAAGGARRPPPAHAPSEPGSSGS